MMTGTGLTFLTYFKKSRVLRVNFAIFSEVEAKCKPKHLGQKNKGGIFFSRVYTGP